MEFKQANIKLIEDLSNYFLSKGFQITKEISQGFSIENDKYIDWIIISTGYAVPNKFIGSINCLRFLKEIDKFLIKYRKVIGARGFPRTFGLQINDESGNSKFKFISECSGEGLVVIYNNIVSSFENYFLPKLNKYSNVSTLDKIANHHIDKLFLNKEEVIFETNTQWHRKLILARLTANEDFTMIYNNIVKIHQEYINQEPDEKEYYEGFISSINELYKELKSISPLNNPEII